MKIIVATAVLCAFGVLSASAADSSSKCQTGNVISNTLYSFNGTVGMTLNTLDDSRNELNNIAQNITEGSGQLVNNTITKFMGNILSTVADFTGVDEDTLRQNCTKAQQEQQDLLNQAQALIAQCASDFTKPVESALNSVADTAQSLVNTIGSAINTADSDCTSASALLGCVSSVIGGIPEDVNSLSSDAINAGLKVTGLDSQAAINKCGSSAVGSVLGTACNSLSDLQTCANNISGN